MYLGIGEKQLEQIDNEQNRNIVKQNILSEYDEKFIPANADEIHKKMIHSLNIILGDMKLHQLLVVTAEDCDALIWNSIFDDLQYYVCENVFGAKRFFEIGSHASLEGDEYYDEYHTMLGCGMIPESTYDFVKLHSSILEWGDKIKEVGNYIKKVAPTKCKWVAFSNDDSYEDCSKGSFEEKKDCYNDMRNAALEKMKWNTEFDEDFTESEDAIGYKVRFTQDMIIHCSFSGTYVYKIVGENENVKMEDIFTEEFNEWLKKMDLWD